MFLRWTFELKTPMGVHYLYRNFLVTVTLYTAFQQKRKRNKWSIMFFFLHPTLPMIRKWWSQKQTEGYYHKHLTHTHHVLFAIIHDNDSFGIICVLCLEQIFENIILVAYIVHSWRKKNEINYFIITDDTMAKIRYHGMCQSSTSFWQYQFPHIEKILEVKLRTKWTHSLKD